MVADMIFRDICWLWGRWSVASRLLKMSLVEVLVQDSVWCSHNSTGFSSMKGREEHNRLSVFFDWFRVGFLFLMVQDRIKKRIGHSDDWFMNWLVVGHLQIS